jgi:serine/threonine-protein kinase
MAPELAEGQDASFSSDIYALGVVLYEMLTGHVPFRGSSAIATLRQQVESPTPTLTGIVPDLPPELDAVLSRAMAKQPGERYPTARALAGDLVALHRTPELVKLARRGGPAGATPTVPVGAPTARTTAPARPAPVSPDAPTRTAAAAPPRRRPAWLVPAVAGAALGALALVVILLVRGLHHTDWPEEASTTRQAATAASPATATAPATAAAAAPARSTNRFRIHVLPDSTVTGRLVSIDDEWVRIETEDGAIERIAYRTVLRIENLGGT